ncbi:MAG: DUF3365 domain-containing protein [Desulfobulbaceae bacterium]|nr:DUF3365 domain-containing protein [Desulfobulbaceae bacterium]
MRLRTKFLLFIGPIILISFGITFIRTHHFQEALIYKQAKIQARMLAQQILLTRKWVADHNGIFLIMQPGELGNSFLEEPIITDDTGTSYIKGNPAMVTRELSAYADEAGFCRFRVTSLAPINPANLPDTFEQNALVSFNKGTMEATAIENTPQGRVLRYSSPLTTKKPCLKCHERHGYQLGDLRGALSLTIPIGWADEMASSNFKLLVGVGVASIICVYITLIFLIELMVVRRLELITAYFNQFPNNLGKTQQLPGGKDEIHYLGKNVVDLGHRLFNSQKLLAEARERMFQTEKMAALGRLSAGVAHEINNPLGGMRNCIKSLTESPNDKIMRNTYLPLIDKGLIRIEQIVRQLLNFGRTEPLRFRTSMVDDLIHEALLLLEYRLKNIKVTLHLTLDKPIVTDVEALKQIIVNIILNAAQAMDNSGAITIETGSDKTMAFIKFRDTGNGIPKDIIDKIFDPFFTTKDAGEGTGMGLAVSFSFVEKMGGIITVNSEIGVGSEFVVFIPLHIMGQGENNGKNITG